MIERKFKRVLYFLKYFRAGLRYEHNPWLPGMNSPAWWETDVPQPALYLNGKPFKP